MTLPVVTALPTPPSRADAPATFNARADAFLDALLTFQAELNAYRDALPGTITGTDYSATSTTSVAIGTGSKSFTIETGKNFQIGQSVRVASTASPANYMDGQVTAHNNGTGALTVNVTAIGGTGTLAAWTIALLPSGAGSFATLGGAETLTNKTLTTPVLSGTASGTTAGRLGYLSGVVSYGDGAAQRTVANLDQAQTFTNKTLDTAGGNVIKINGNTLAASAGTATLTLPNATDTLVGRSTNDTLANKTIGSGSTINTSVTLTESGTISASTVGFRGMPQNYQGSANYTLALTDQGKHVLFEGASSTMTIPANSSVAFPVGSTIVIVNDTNVPRTISPAGGVTLVWAGNSALTGSRSMGTGSVASLVKIGTDKWYISGAGLS